MTNNPKVGPVLAKKYVLVRQDSSGPLAKDIRDKYKVSRNSIAILTSDGEVLARLQNEPPPEAVYNAIEGIPEFRAGNEQLMKLKDAGITKANAEAVATALKRIGTLQTKEASDIIVEFAKDDKALETVQRGAILALGKHPEAAGDVIPYLTDKRYPIKSAAQTTVTAMGIKALPALLEGLASESVDSRAACFGPAMTATKNAKLAKDLTFWKTGKEDARSKALTEWKTWYEEQSKPKAKDDVPPKKK